MGFEGRVLQGEAGVLLRPLGATVYWMPPYVIGEAEIGFLVDAVTRVLDAGSESR